MEDERGGFVVERAAGLGALDASAWDALVGDAPPFLEHAFLASLEDAGCVGADTGWDPVTLLVRQRPDGELIGAAFAYLKTHSMGEFVFDWAWADAARRNGIRYYPKLVLAAPFTPVEGPRLLVAPGLSPDRSEAVRRALLEEALRVARDAGCSGVHVLFCTEAERDLAVRLGFTARLGLQFHWDNEGYERFDDFLARFRSKRRNQIRRERRRVTEAGFELVSRTGDEVRDADRELAQDFYHATMERHVWARPYLNDRFFELLWARMRPRLQLLLAEREGRVVAGTLNMQKGDRRWGRYWGCEEEHRYLHFEVCSYAAIEDCIAQGIQRFEAGAGGGGHKYGRGFLPAYTHSVHWLFHPGLHDAAADFCRREAEVIEREAEELRQQLFVR